MSDTFRTHNGRTLQQAASDVVAREVLCCLSSMVSTLANGHCAVSGTAAGLRDLADQAVELCTPVLDFEQAALEAGWTIQDGMWVRVIKGPLDGGVRKMHRKLLASEACEWDDIEPHELEVYEHWAVSTWLAEKLQAAGERVDTDFAGLCVWARTTTGQAISMDAVIERITREMHAAQDDAIDAISYNLTV